MLHIAPANIDAKPPIKRRKLNKSSYLYTLPVYFMETRTNIWEGQNSQALILKTANLYAFFETVLTERKKDMV